MTKEFLSSFQKYVQEKKYREKNISLIKDIDFLHFNLVHLLLQTVKIKGYIYSIYFKFYHGICLKKLQFYSEEKYFTGFTNKLKVSHLI